MIYFDNAATTWPKPPGVAEAVLNFVQHIGGSPGRSGHRLAVEANRVVYDTREALATLFGVADPLRIVFTANVTEALNLVLFGYLRPGDHVVTTSMEHNSVMRPLRYLQSLGVELTVVPCSSEGVLDAADVEKAIRPNTVLLAVNHASNAVGTIQPVADIGMIARQHGLLLLVDAAQTAGAYPIDMDQMHIDLLAFTGHKALFGPQGTGGLCLGERVELDRLRPLTRGGTGSQSELEEQPDFLPDKYESGTANGVGIAGLGAGVRFVLEQGIENIRQHEQMLTERLLAGLQDIPGVCVYGTRDARRQTACVSFNIKGIEPSDVALRLDEEYAILCRPGLHCAPAAHRTIGTYPRGTVRFGLSYFNSVEEVDAAIRAVRNIAMKKH
ncbi:MAG: aminotransferase class V-fold PLP-dependent enzyme [Chloroflexi bacterium]|nr:aminotransferase class V-fold PLP-dependent enzyme [Chloroflexota bacterium]